MQRRQLRSARRDENRCGRPCRPITVGPVTTIEAISTATDFYREARWEDAYHVLVRGIADAEDDLGAARCRVLLVEGYNNEDFKRGLQRGRDKHALLDAAEEAARAHGDDRLLADVHFQRGMALHIDFIMAEGDEERELASFTEAARLYEAAGDAEGAAMATAMMGVYHHVDRLDRATAEPILRRAYESAPPGASLARAEAARHLGQIQQELGDPAGGLALLEESLEIRRQAGWEVHFPSAMQAVGYARLEAGDLGGAREVLLQAREIAERLDARLPLAFITRNLGDVAMAELIPNIWRRTHP
jgi:tetratricopeptide (TPR) repeat protein